VRDQTILDDDADDAHQGETAVADERIDSILFDLPARPMTKEEKIRLIKEMIQEKKYLTRERLDAAIAKMIDEIDKD
jgi:hypothetical protein